MIPDLPLVDLSSPLASRQGNSRYQRQSGPKEILVHVLGRHTTFGIGGTARTVVEAQTGEELVEALRTAWADQEGWLVLGGGSNILISDDHFDGTAILSRSNGIRRLAGSSHTAPFSTFRVDAGVNWDHLVEFTVSERLAGIEALSGIPGTVGAAPIQNIGAYGQEVGGCLVAVDFLRYGTTKSIRVNADRLALGYRSSALLNTPGAVVSVELSFQATDGVSLPIRYAELAQHLGLEVGAVAPLEDVRSAVLEIRARKGTLLGRGEHAVKSAGSFFKNPTVSYRALPREAPSWPLSEPLSTEIDEVRTSAAWLIENSGVPKGFTLGTDAAVSKKHALSLVNLGRAKAIDVVDLAQHIQRRVESAFGVTLEAEPRLFRLAL